jgi:hypothetical protein
MQNKSQRRCCDCGIAPPHASNDPDPDSTTLISMRYGWRLSRREEATGEYAIEWRCPECWKRRKSHGADIPPAPDSSTRTTEETALRSGRRQRG